MSTFGHSEPDLCGCGQKIGHQAPCLFTRSRNRPYADLTDDELRELEESLYDSEIAGNDTWFQRDQVLWEMNWRGMCG